jgi:hypothetical protein
MGFSGWQFGKPAYQAAKSCHGKTFLLIGYALSIPFLWDNCNQVFDDRELLIYLSISR